MNETAAKQINPHKMTTKYEFGTKTTQIASMGTN